MRNKKAERAKMFLPFASLRGFQNYLSEKERVVVPKKDLSLDECDILNIKIHQLKVGDMVKIVHYDHDNYIETRGLITKIEIDCEKRIQVVGTSISLLDIIEINKESLFEK